MHTSHYSRLEKPTIPLATQERLPRIRVYIARIIVPITTHTHDRRKSIGKKETKKRKEDKGKERKDKKAKKSKKERKEKKRQDRKG